MRACADCGCRLSRYNPDDVCAACYAASDTSHDEYLRELRTPEALLRGADTCKRGHDLLIHGRIVDAGDGRTTRRCSICRADRQREYQRRRRAGERVR